MSLEPHTRSDPAFADERQAEIARIVDEQGRARVTELAHHFGVSTVTIRKDLYALAEADRVVRTHGGAIAPGSAVGSGRERGELAYEVRDRLQRDEKDAIGAVAAADLIGDGESIILDASTTALHVARHLMRQGPWHRLTVVTNNIRIATELAGRPGITVLMLGGRVRWEALSVVGQLGDAVFSRVNAQKAFLGAAGFTIEEGLTDAQEEEAQIKRAMVTAAREVYAIVDHSKWGRVASVTFAGIEDLTGVVTDSEPPAAMAGALRRAGIEIYTGGAHQ